MTTLLLPRRSFLSGVISLLAAPAIVRASSLMGIKALPVASGFAIGDVVTFGNSETQWLIKAMTYLEDTLSFELATLNTHTNATLSVIGDLADAKII